MKKQHRSAVLLVGIFLCAMFALYPPRRIINNSDMASAQFEHVQGKPVPFDVPHGFLFSSEFGIYHASGDRIYPAETDGGRLLAELALIGSITAGVVLIPSLFGKTSHDA